MLFRSHLSDASGVLPVVVLRCVTQSDLFLENMDKPLQVLCDCLGRVLHSPALLKELVREADAEWGQVVGERPYFEQEGRAPNPDDPYTFESVRADLSRLLESLRPSAI